MKARSVFCSACALLLGCGGNATAARSTPPLAVVAPIDEPIERPAAAWVATLAPLHVHNVNSTREGDVALYDRSGAIDEDAARKLDAILAPKDGETKPVNRRLLQLVYKVAAHFHANDVEVLSSWRPSARPGSRHASGDAIDFTLAGVRSPELAAHLRTYARVGVGIYTNPRTGFVHLDVRDESFHWLDASPPGRTWKEHGITDRGAQARDAAYTIEQDLPTAI